MYNAVGDFYLINSGKSGAESFIGHLFCYNYHNEQENSAAFGSDRRALCGF